MISATAENSLIELPTIRAWDTKIAEAVCSCSVVDFSSSPEAPACELKVAMDAMSIFSELLLPLNTNILERQSGIAQACYLS